MLRSRSGVRKIGSRELEHLSGELFVGCCASAGKQSAKSMAQRERTDEFVLHVFSLSRSTCTRTRLSHLITLSARYSTDCGIVSPICFAVLRLMTSSNFIGCSTGRSAGFVPFNILST